MSKPLTDGQLTEHKLVMAYITAWFLADRAKKDSTAWIIADSEAGAYYQSCRIIGVGHIALESRRKCKVSEKKNGKLTPANARRIVTTELKKENNK